MGKDCTGVADTSGHIVLAPHDTAKADTAGILPKLPPEYAREFLTNIECRVEARQAEFISMGILPGPRPPWPTWRYLMRLQVFYTIIALTAGAVTMIGIAAYAFLWR
jgi:hypothetical protein